MNNSHRLAHTIYVANIPDVDMHASQKSLSNMATQLQSGGGQRHPCQALFVASAAPTVYCDHSAKTPPKSLIRSNSAKIITIIIIIKLLNDPKKLLINHARDLIGLVEGRSYVSTKIPLRVVSSCTHVTVVWI